MQGSSCLPLIINPIRVIGPGPIVNCPGEACTLEDGARNGVDPECLLSLQNYRARKTLYTPNHNVSLWCEGQRKRFHRRSGCRSPVAQRLQALHQKFLLTFSHSSWALVKGCIIDRFTALVDWDSMRPGTSTHRNRELDRLQPACMSEGRPHGRWCNQALDATGTHLCLASACARRGHTGKYAVQF